MISLPTIASATSPANPAWDEAFARVESYLSAHGLVSRVLLNQVTAEIIGEARGRAQSGRPEAPVTLAMEITHERISAWLARAGRELDPVSGRVGAEGRLALVVADLPGRWADYFLNSAPPAELTDAMTSFRFLPGPELQLTNMAAAPLEFGFPPSEDPGVPARRIWVSARTAVSWLVILGFFGIAWATSH